MTLINICQVPIYFTFVVIISNDIRFSYSLTQPRSLIHGKFGFGHALLQYPPRHEQISSEQVDSLIKVPLLIS